MRKLIYKSVIVCVLTALSINTFAQGNHYYSGSTLYDPYGRCQMYFPKEPTYGKQNLEAGDMGTVTMYQFMYESPDQTFVYMLAYVDYPADKMASQDVEVMLKKAAKGFVGALSLTSQSENIINYGNYKGIMFYADNGSNYAVMRDYIVNNRLYQMGIYRIGGPIKTNEENEFFDSFVLTN